jgi:hypothetical protein
VLYVLTVLIVLAVLIVLVGIIKGETTLPYLSLKKEHYRRKPSSLSDGYYQILAFTVFGWKKKLFLFLSCLRSITFSLQKNVRLD